MSFSKPGLDQGRRSDLGQVVKDAVRTGDINALIEACIKDLSNKPEKLQNPVVKVSDIFKHPGGALQLHRIRKGKRRLSTAPLQRQLSAPDVALRKLLTVTSFKTFRNILKYICFGVQSYFFGGPKYQATFSECFVFRWPPQCSKLGIKGNK